MNWNLLSFLIMLICVYHGTAKCPIDIKYDALQQASKDNLVELNPACAYEDCEVDGARVTDETATDVAELSECSEAFIRRGKLKQKVTNGYKKIVVVENP
eukprot:329093_1